MEEPRIHSICPRIYNCCTPNGVFSNPIKPRWVSLRGLAAELIVHWFRIASKLLQVPRAIIKRLDSWSSYGELGGYFWAMLIGAMCRIIQTTSIVSFVATYLLSLFLLEHTSHYHVATNSSHPRLVLVQRARGATISIVFRSLPYSQHWWLSDYMVLVLWRFF